MYGMLSILGRHERAPDREFEVVFSNMGKDFMTIDGRAFVGNTPVFRAKVGRARAVGRDGDRAPTSTPSTCTGTAGSPPTGRATRRPSARPSRSAIRWVEDAPGTWLYHCHVEDHMMRGMIGIYQVSASEAALDSRRGRRGAGLPGRGRRRAGEARGGVRRSSPRTGRRSSTSCRGRRCSGRTSARAPTPSPPTRGSSTPTTSGPTSASRSRSPGRGRTSTTASIHSSIRGEVDVRRVILDTLPTAAVPVGDAVEFTGRTADPSRPIEIQRSVGRQALRDDRPCRSRVATAAGARSSRREQTGDYRARVGRLGERDAAAARRHPPACTCTRRRPGSASR